jgi:hypothetical protein
MAGDGEVTGMRIGELSRRVGLSDHVLRAWENRYRLLEPVRPPAASGSTPRTTSDASG